MYQHNMQESIFCAMVFYQLLGDVWCEACFQGILHCNNLNKLSEPNKIANSSLFCSRLEHLRGCPSFLSNAFTCRFQVFRFIPCSDFVVFPVTGIPARTLCGSTCRPILGVFEPWKSTAPWTVSQKQSILDGWDVSGRLGVQNVMFFSLSIGNHPFIDGFSMILPYK